MARESTTAGSLPRAPRGTTLTCKGWAQEAALRLLLNSLDPELAECPAEFLVYDGQAAARDGDALRAVLEALTNLADDETLTVKSGAMAGVQRTTPDFPRLLLIAERASLPGDPVGSRPDVSPAEPTHGTAPLAPKELLRRAAASWCYAGAQAVLQPSCELLASAAARDFGGTLAGKLVLQDGLDAAGAARVLAAALAGGAVLALDGDAARVKRAVKAGYCDVMVNSLDEALRILKNNVRMREPVAVGLVGDPAAARAELASRGVVPDLELLGTLLGSADRAPAQARAPEAKASVALDPLGDGDSVPLTCTALSGEPADIVRIDRLLLESFPGDERLAKWLPIARRVHFQGLPARALWLKRVQVSLFAVSVNDLVGRGEVRAPMVLGRVFPPGNLAVHPLGASAEKRQLAVSLAAASWAAIEIPAGERAAEELPSCAMVADGSAEATQRLAAALED